MTKRMSSTERRKQILRVAVAIFARSNYKTATVKEMAQEIGISEAAIFNHFPTKKSIFLAILDRIHARIIAFWQAEIDKDDDALTTLRNMGLKYMERISDHPQELKVQFQAISEVDDGDIKALLKNHHQHYVDTINRVITSGINVSTFPADFDAASLAYAFDALGVFANLMNLVGEERFDVNRANKILDLILPMDQSGASLS